MIKITVEWPDGAEGEVMDVILPMVPQELGAMKLAAITSKHTDDVVLRSMECDIPNLEKKLRELEIFDYSNIDSLNSLAKRIESLTPVEREQFMRRV
jgi:hypothetical protein